MSECEECHKIKVPPLASTYLKEEVLEYLNGDTLYLAVDKLNSSDATFLLNVLPLTSVSHMFVILPGRENARDEALAVALVRAAAPTHEVSVRVEAFSHWRDNFMQILGDCIAPITKFRRLRGSPTAWDTLLLRLAAHQGLQQLEMMVCDAMECSPSALRAVMLNPTLHTFVISGDVAKMTPGHVEAIADAVRRSRTLRVLALYEMRVADGQLAPIIQAVADEAFVMETLGIPGSVQESRRALASVRGRMMVRLSRQRMRQAADRPTRTIRDFTGF